MALLSKRFETLLLRYYFETKKSENIFFNKNGNVQNKVNLSILKHERDFENVSNR
jgi:hypothetical protein